MLALAVTCSFSQDRALPYSPVQGADYSSCPSATTNNPSAWRERCGAINRRSDLLDAGRQFFASVTATGGHDSAFNARKGLPAPFGGAVLSGGLVAPRPKGYDVIENTTSLVDYHTSPERTLEYLNSTTISLNRVPSVRDVFTLNISNTFGNDAIRILLLDGGVPSDEAASYGIHAGKVLNNQATARYTRQSTETRWWALSLRNNFRDFIDDKTRLNTAHERAEIHYQPSEHAGIGLFQQISVQTGDVDCGTVSVGLVYERRFGQRMAAEGSGGPAFGSKGCTSRIAANLYGTFSADPSPSTNLWVSAYRKVNDSDFALLSYESNAQAGITQRFGQQTWLRAHGGWIGGTPASQTTPYRGLFAASTVGRTLGAGFTFSVSAQHYEWSGLTNIAPSRTIVSGSLSWSPGSSESQQSYGPLRQQ